MPRLIKSTRYGQFSRPGLLKPEFTEKQMFLTRYFIRASGRVKRYHLLHEQKLSIYFGHATFPSYK